MIGGPAPTVPSPERSSGMICSSWRDILALDEMLANMRLVEAL